MKVEEKDSEEQKRSKTRECDEEEGRDSQGECWGTISMLCCVKKRGRTVTPD